MKKKSKLVAGILAGVCLVGGGFALAGCGEKSPQLEVFRDFQLEYEYGEEINVEHGMLKYTEGGITQYIEITEDMISCFDSEVAGEQILVITYEGISIEVEYVVNQPTLIPYDQIYYLAGDYPIIFCRDSADSVVYLQQMQGNISQAASAFIAGLKYTDYGFEYTSSFKKGKEVLTLHNPKSQEEITVSISDDGTEIYIAGSTFKLYNQNTTVIPYDEIYYLDGDYPIIFCRDSADSVVYLQQMEGPVEDAVKKFSEGLKYSDYGFEYTSSIVNGKEILTLHNPKSQGTITVSINDDGFTISVGGLIMTKYVG